MKLFLPQGQFLAELEYENKLVKAVENSLSVFGLLLLGILIFLAMSPAQRQHPLKKPR